MSDLAMLGVGLLLTIGTGLFVASEFALVNLDRNDLERRQQRGERRLGPTISALRITSTHLSSAQLGITLTTLLTGYTFEPAMSSLLEGPLTSAGVPEMWVRPVGAVTGVVLATLMSMIVGELVPKNFALAVPLATAKAVVPFQIAFTTVFKPVIRLLNGTANRTIRAMGIEPKEELSGARTAEELTYLIRHSAATGVLPEDEATLLDRTLKFAGFDAVDLMTPRVSMATVPYDATAADVLRTARETGFSRLPIVEDGPDDIVGLVHAKRAFAVPLADRETTLARSLAIEPMRVPETVPADALLTMLRREGLQFAVVADEHGGTAGIVTLEDLVEEIVGELEDEHDRVRSEVNRRGHAVSFNPALRPDELLDRAGVSVPEGEDWDTVAGFLTHELGRLAEPGDEVSVDGGVFRVERVVGSRILRVCWQPDDVDGRGADTAEAAATAADQERGCNG